MTLAIHGRWNIGSGATLWWIRNILPFGLLTTGAGITAFVVILTSLAQRIIASGSIATIVWWLLELSTSWCIWSCHLLLQMRCVKLAGWFVARSNSIIYQCDTTYRIQRWRTVLEASRHHVTAIEIRIRKIQHWATWARLLRHCTWNLWMGHQQFTINCSYQTQSYRLHNTNWTYVTDWTWIVVRSCEPSIWHGWVCYRANIGITYTTSTQACRSLIIYIIISRLKIIQKIKWNFTLNFYWTNRIPE